MKTIGAIILAFSLFAGGLAAQTGTCSTSNPCVQLPVNNTTPLPATVVVWSCMGSTGCGQTDLSTILQQQTTTNICSQPSGSPWHCTTFTQTKTPQVYNDAEPYDAMMSYALQSVTSGGPSQATAIATFQVPQAQGQTPTLGTIKMVTTGPVGPN